MTEEQVRALFTLAEIPVQGVYKIENRYWPESYVELRRDNPWWLVKTPAGLVQIGWRKRVISINWSDTAFRQVITEDDVTKDELMVHAWGWAKALEYMTAWRRAALIA